MGFHAIRRGVPKGVIQGEKRSNSDQDLVRGMDMVITL